MKRKRTRFPALLFLTAAVLAMACPAGWGQEYVEASGTGIAPRGMPVAQARAMARRAAILDLRRRLAARLGGGPDGYIRGVEIFGGAWDGTSYSVSGRVREEAVR
jgi:hypothetical protein